MVRRAALRAHDNLVTLVEINIANLALAIIFVIFHARLLNAFAVKLNFTELRQHYQPEFCGECPNLELTVSTVRPKRIKFIFFGTHSSTKLNYGFAEGPAGLRRIAVPRCLLRVIQLYAKTVSKISLQVSLKFDIQSKEEPG